MSEQSTLDELMWLLADEGEPQAVHAFLKRHPECEKELMHRIQMVRALKGTRPQEPSPVQRHFAPSSHLPEYSNQRSPLPWWGYAIGLLVVSIGSYAATRALMDAPAAAIPVAQQSVELRDSTESTQPAQTIPIPTEVPQNPPIVQNPPQGDNRYDRPVDLSSSETTLFAVLNDIQLQTGLEITALPGLQNVPLKINYLQTPAIQVLRDLGITFEFTVFEQGPTEVLLVPAVDPAKRESREASGVPNIEPSESGQTEPLDIVDPAP